MSMLDGLSAPGAASGEAMPTPEWRTPFECVAPDGWRVIDFISDLHLASHTPRTLAAWAAYLDATPADALFILGDLFEAWVGDDSRFQDTEARCVEVLRQASRHCKLFFMVGNRDFLVGPDMLEASGMHALPDPTVLSAFGRKILLIHGDELCLSDVAYQRFRHQVRNAAWQRQVLAQPLQARLAMARMLRDGSLSNAPPGTAAPWVDLDKGALVSWMQQAGSPDVVHGHTHRPATEAFGEGLTRHVLSDWDLESDESRLHRAEVLRLTATGFQRLPISPAPSPETTPDPGR